MSTGWLNLATVPRQAFRPPLGGPSHPVPDQSEEIQAARERESVAVRALQKKQKLSQGNPTEMVKTEPTVTAFISATSNDCRQLKT
ncbi:hypothetical protein RSAG8_09008, partial [Rhizoctonia solani AG-8 WAC10335]